MTTRKPLVAAVALVLSLAAHPASAQLADPTRTRSATQVVQPPPPPPPPRQLQSPPPATPSPMPTQLGQRAQPTPVATPAQPPSPRDDDDAAARRIGAPPAKVYDRNGRALEGMEQAGPNRVRDTRTGRYYDTVPMGDGQRIQPGR